MVLVLALPLYSLADVALVSMSYDDIEIEDMEWNEELSAFTYPCPCGDLFQITKVLACCQLRHYKLTSGIWHDVTCSYCKRLCRKSLLRGRK